MSVVCSTAVVTINPAFFQEIKEVNQELWHILNALRERCAVSIAIHHRRGLCDLLQELRDQLALHFALEEAYGYFQDPVAAAPQLSDRAEKLRDEHRELYLDLSAFADEAERKHGYEDHEAFAIWIGPRFRRFDTRLRDHERRENDLIYDAYESDLGVGD